MRSLPDKAATYEEWGAFLVQIFHHDPKAICGGYKGVEDFHEKTRHQFA